MNRPGGGYGRRISEENVGSESRRSNPESHRENGTSTETGCGCDESHGEFAIRSASTANAGDERAFGLIWACGDGAAIEREFEHHADDRKPQPAQRPRPHGLRSDVGVARSGCTPGTVA